MALRLLPEPAEVVYEFSRALEPVRASANAVYWDRHRRVEAEGRLAHTADACPERQGFTVRQ